MKSLSWAASLPYQQVARLAQVRRREWPVLQRPSISVGNLAFGGRGKTPVTAALAKQAQARGLRPAILSRGYGGTLRGVDPPKVLQGVEGPAWLQDVAKNRDLCGEEACWLAATCAEVPVGVHRDRIQAATIVLEQGDVDLFLLDDGFQSRLQRDIDLVLLDASCDPPFTEGRVALRESTGALHRAQFAGIFGMSQGAHQSLETGAPARLPSQLDLHPLERKLAKIRLLSDGSRVSRSDWPEEVWVAAAVGQPESVIRVLTASGILSTERIFLRDHGRPSARQIERLNSAPLPVLITEKDAVGWASQSLREALVLELAIDGVEPLAALILDRLFP